MTSAKNRRVLVLLALMAASLVGLLLLPPIAQDQSYHEFADQRTLFGIPNFWNVVSNFPFVAIGAVGLWQFRRNPAIDVLFLGILLTGFGSAYYHLDPNDRTLFWDRLPMAISFMAILAISIEERVDAKAGNRFAVALDRSRRIQPVAVALDRRSAALWLGAVLSLPRVTAALLAVSGKIQRHVVLDRRRGVICSCKVVRVLRQRNLFYGVHFERPHSQAHRRSRRLFRRPETFPKAPAEKLSLQPNQPVNLLALKANSTNGLMVQQ